MSRHRPLPHLLPVLAALCGLLLAVPAAGDDDDRRSEIRIPVDPDVRVDVEILSGKIEIEGWDRDEVRVRARGDDPDALAIDAEDDRVSIRAALDGARWLPFATAGAEVDLRIDVPKGAHVEAKTLNGPIRARDVEGRVFLHAANGEIDVRGTPEEARLETLNSGIEFRGECPSVDARTMNGRIDLRGVRGEVVASTMNGSVRVRGGAVERADLRTLSGSIELEASLQPGARVFGKTYSGAITLELPEDTSARFDIQTFSGSIRNDFGSRERAARRRTAGERLDVEVGGGDGRVTLETFSGSVRLRARD